MPAVELILVLLVAVVILAMVARRIHLPYPIVLVLGGLALGFVPGMPRVALQPEIVFLVFLPPLLFKSAWFTSARDFRAALRSISLLATGLVVYRFAVAAAATGVFVLWQAGLQFVLVSAGGIAVGLAVGWILAQIQLRMEDPLIEITLTFLASIPGGPWFGDGGGRDLVLYLTFSVILVTLVLQGISLPAVLRLLRVTGDGGE